MEYVVNSEDIINAFLNCPQKLKKLTCNLESVVLSDGRIAEIQVILTTVQKDFCINENEMKGEI